MSETVGVVIPTILNDFATIERTLSSIVSQKTLPNEVVISVQTFACDESDIEKLQNYVNSNEVLKNITKISVTDTKGLSVNRNNGLEQVNSDILVFLDDDTELLEEAIEDIQNAFSENNDAQAITFKTLDENGKDRKKYQPDTFQRNKFSIMGVSSIEVAVRNDFIRKHNIKFNEDFGIAAKFPIAEENLFMNDILESGGKVLFLPVNINKHPHISTGSAYTDNIMRAHGAAIGSIFGLWAIFMIPAFITKKTLSRHIKNPFNALYQMLDGALDYRNK